MGKQTLLMWLSSLVDELSFRLWMWHLRRLIHIDAEWFVYSRTRDIWDEMARLLYAEDDGARAVMIRRAFDRAMADALANGVPVHKTGTSPLWSRT